MIPDWARNKKILLGVSGGIAAYKTPELVRSWVGFGCEVEVVLTKAARRLVSPLVLSTLSKRRTWTEEDFLSDENGWRIPHIALGDWADVFVVAPCTANALRAAATGDSSSLLGATMLACPAPIVLFPAMNVHMWENPATKNNVRIARENGVSVIDPDSGSLACGYEGKGRLPSIEAILDETWFALRTEKDFVDRRILITAGPTQEYIDPVRFVGNPSSGRMGYALAAEARYRGAEVVLITGPSHERIPSGVRARRVVSAEEMLLACMEELPNVDIVIKAAAVGDYRVKNRSATKIKRDGSEELLLELVQNPDIAREIAKRKKPGQLLIGFAAETDHVEANARKKIKSKELDAVVANDVSGDDAGFAVETNRVRVYFSERHARAASRELSGGKWSVASAILDLIVNLPE